jgi:hypothetical protein
MRFVPRLPQKWAALTGRRSRVKCLYGHKRDKLSLDLASVTSNRAAPLMGNADRCSPGGYSLQLLQTEQKPLWPASADRGRPPCSRAGGVPGWVHGSTPPRFEQSHPVVMTRRFPAVRPERGSAVRSSRCFAKRRTPASRRAGPVDSGTRRTLRP